MRIKEQAILGTLLGDASIYSDRTTYRLDISHGWKQFEYLKWKAKLIGADQSISQYETGYGSVGYRIRYYNKEILEPIASIVLENGVKRINDEWLSRLNILSLALWYQDDGTWGKDGPYTKNKDRGSRCITFSTEGFDTESIHLLAEYLTSRGYAAHIHKSKRKYEVISLNHSATIKFWKDISPYVFIRSKIDTSKRPGISYCKCGICIEPKMGMCTPCLQKIAKDQNRQRLIRRFGTSKIDVINSMNVTADLVSEYWIDLSHIGVCV
jgi:LAGLIDADG DNA endonuclease family